MSILSTSPTILKPAFCFFDFDTHPVLFKGKHGLGPVKLVRTWNAYTQKIRLFRLLQKDKA